MTSSPASVRLSVACICFVSLFASALPAPARVRRAAPAPTTRSLATATPERQTQQATEVYDALPLSFEPNVGQTDARVRFLARGAGYTIFLTEDAAVLALAGGGRADAAPGPGEQSKTRDARAEAGLRREALRMRLLGARAGASLEGDRALPGRSNYLSGSDPAGWRRDVPTYAAVRYEGVYAGVDAVFYGNRQQLEYDFEVRPGADPSQIRVQFEGQQAARVNDAGDLMLRMRGGELRQQRAIVYQESTNGKQAVGARYIVGPDGEVAFEIGEYDQSRTLVIDPVLVYADYLGGSLSNDGAYAVDVDASGAAYVTGRTDAVDFPATAGAFSTSGGFQNSSDTFVAKVSVSGASLVYATYLGGEGQDTGYGVAVDASGSAYVTGETTSPDFPTASAFAPVYNGGVEFGYAPDAFVTKLSADGSALVFSTFLGGRFGDSGYGIAIDGAGAAYVTGQTSSFDLPTTPGAYDSSYNGTSSTTDVFVTKLSAGGALVYSTFLGGFGSDVGRAIAVDASNAAYVTGSTVSVPDFPTTPGAYDTSFNNSQFYYGYNDAFVTKVSADGAALVYSTFLGGTGDDVAYGIAVDGAGAAFTTGRTYSGDYPTTPNAYRATFLGSADAFVTKLGTDGAALIYSTFLGGPSDDAGYGIALGLDGTAYVTGQTSSIAYPTTANAADRILNDGECCSHDAFATRLGVDGGSLVFSTFLGGEGVDVGYGIAVDASGAAFVTGVTQSSLFSTTPGAFDLSYNDGEDAFVTKLTADGSALAYSTFLAGSVARGQSIVDEGLAVAVDSTGAVYVTGRTLALTFPVTAGAFDPSQNEQSGNPYNNTDDAFVTKLSADGSTLVYSTFLGGQASDSGQGIAVDLAGLAFVAGRTNSSDFPTTPRAFDTVLGNGSSNGYDAFAVKLSADGSGLLYSTFLGGGADDEARAVAIDSAGAAYVTGPTGSVDFSTAPGAYDATYNGYGYLDAFVTKFSADGSSLVYSTFLGSSSNDVANGIAVDAAGAAYVTGETTSPSFPTTPGAFDTTYNGYPNGSADAFVTKLHPSGGSLLYSTYLGGTFEDIGYAITVDGAGAAYVTGSTASNDYPTPGGFDTTVNASGEIYYRDAFVTKLGASGNALGYSSFLGGESEDAGFGIAVDAGGVAHVTGRTASTAFPITPGALDTTLNSDPFNSGYGDAFLTEVGPSGNALTYSTYLGGDFEDLGRGIAIDAAGATYIVGSTSSSDFATTGFGARDASNAFVAKLGPTPSDAEAAIRWGSTGPRPGRGF
jgi:hypothetical protein